MFDVGIISNAEFELNITKCRYHFLPIISYSWMFPAATKQTKTYARLTRVIFTNHKNKIIIIKIKRKSNKTMMSNSRETILSTHAVIWSVGVLFDLCAILSIPSSKQHTQCRLIRYPCMRKWRLTCEIEICIKEKQNKNCSIIIHQSVYYMYYGYGLLLNKTEMAYIRCAA